MPIKQHIEREQEAFEELNVTISRPNSEQEMEHYKKLELVIPIAFDLLKPSLKSFLAQSLTRVTTAMMKEARKIVIEENYTLEEYLGHLEGKVTGFEIAQHTMKTRNNITKRLEDITPAPTSGEVTNK